MTSEAIHWFPPLQELYAAKAPVDPKRPVFQGDIFDDVVCYRYPSHPAVEVAPRGRRGYAMVLGHPCEISPEEKGAALEWRAVCPVVEDRDGRLHLDGESHFYAFPLPDLFGDERIWYADFRFVSSCHRDYIDLQKRVAALSEVGWYALQRRLTHFFTRVLVDQADLVAVGERLHPDATSH